MTEKYEEVLEHDSTVGRGQAGAGNNRPTGIVDIDDLQKNVQVFRV